MTDRNRKKILIGTGAFIFIRIIAIVYRTFIVYSYGSVYSSNVTYAYGVCPVAYLISDIQFDGNHTGSSSNHYQLKI
jgi:hypothetical protein